MNLSHRNLKEAVSLLILVLTLTTASAQAYEEAYRTVDLRISPFYLNAGETHSIALPYGWTHVQKLFIQASGYYGDAAFDVVVNGDTKGTVHVPGWDPSYVVTVGESTDSLQLRHISGGSAWIQSITVVEAIRRVPMTPSYLPSDQQYPPLPLEARNEASWIALDAIRTVDGLQHFANYTEFGEYLLPIKKAAGRAYASAEGRGGLATRTRALLEALKAQIAFASDYLDATFERDAAFDLAVHLKGLGEKLDQALR